MKLFSEIQTNTMYDLSRNLGGIGIKDFLSNIEMPINRDYGDLDKKGFLTWMEGNGHKIDSFCRHFIHPVGFVAVTRKE